MTDHTVLAQPAAELHVAENKIGFGRWFRELGFRHIIGMLAVIYAAFPIVYIVSAALNPNISTTLTGANTLFRTSRLRTLPSFPTPCFGCG